MKKGIKERMLRTFLAISTILIVSNIVLSVLMMFFLHQESVKSNSTIGTNIFRTNEEILLKQAEESAERFAKAKAENIASKLLEYKNDVSNIADETKYMYEHQEEYKEKRVLRPGELLLAGIADQENLMWAPCDANASESAQVEAEVKLLGNLEAAFSSLMNSHSNILGIYVTTESGISMGYDVNAMQKLDREYIETRNREWYVITKESEEIHITEPYEDNFGRGLTITVAKSVIVDGIRIGAVGIDILIENLSKDIFNTSFGENGSGVLLTENGTLVSARGLQNNEMHLENYFGEDNEKIITEILSSDNGIKCYNIEGKEVYTVHTPVPEVDWKLIILMPKLDIVEPINKTEAATNDIIEQTISNTRLLIIKCCMILLLVSFLILCLMIYAIRKVCTQITGPIEKLTVDIGRFAIGELDYRSSIKTGDEIEILSKSFEDMSITLKEYVKNLTNVSAEKERIETELHVAAQIQADMLPSIFPAFPERKEFDVYALMNPAKEVGGDFYDFFLIDEDHLGIVIADVSGKGVPAALFMVIAKTLIKNHAQAGESPKDIFTKVNGQLCESNEAALFVTAWMGILEIGTGRFTCVNAGHNPPLRCKKDGSYEWIMLKPGFVLAGLAKMKYQETVIYLEMGERLFFYTDGVTEAMNVQDELFGEERLLRELNDYKNVTLEEQLSHVKKTIDCFSEGREQFDDITMLCMEYMIKGDNNGEN